MSPVATPLEDRFWTHVDASGDCWEWTGGTTVGGYGNAFIGSRPRRWGPAHRVAYELLVGPVPEALVLDHRCRVRLCVNPDHLEPVTQQENVRRGFGHGRETHCPHGHEYSEANTYVDRRNRRFCRTCNKASAARRSASRRSTCWERGEEAVIVPLDYCEVEA